MVAVRAGARWKDNLQRARYIVPAEDLERPIRRRWTTLQGAVIMSLFDLNDAAITRYGGELPSVYDTADFPWVRRLEDATDAIRAELARYVESHDPLPHVAEVSGLEPGTEEAMNSAPIDRGEWRVLILLANGKWIDETAGHFPAARAATADCPQMTTVGFSALEPRSHIAGHVGTNRGALRFQLPIVVPGNRGTAASRSVTRWSSGRRAAASSSISVPGTRPGTMLTPAGSSS